MRLDAARRASDALTELQAALTALSEVHSAGRRFGADWLPLRADVAEVVEILRSIIR
jgi:hypothetical protein